MSLMEPDLAVALTDEHFVHTPGTAAMQLGALKFHPRRLDSTTLPVGGSGTVLVVLAMRSAEVKLKSP
ncbi:MAG: hypothetical protein IPK32_19375 [Verrucomicrobiaceae bacterium]|nr:hypothetical protein [Verrucomicrobiaceae bacterium]